MGITDDIKNLLKSGELLQRFDKQIRLLDDLTKKVTELTSTLKETNEKMIEFIAALEKLEWIATEKSN